jgi:ribosomal protein L16 Arg81 hydroxylase
MTFTLERLIAPIGRDEFLRAHWEAQPLVVRREDRNYWRELLTVDDLNRVLTTRNMHHPGVGLITAERKIAAEDFAYPSGLVDTARLYRHFADGATISLNGFEVEHPALAALCRSMERELSTRFQTNLYYTPANAQGFRTHYDSHDVFVLQMSGSKHWRLYNTPVELPYRRQEFKPDEHTSGEVTAEFVLHEGDLAYVPRGVMHDARTTGEESLHVTLGVLFTSWTDLIAESLGMLGLSDPRFRRGLPAGFAHADFDRTKARAEFHSLLKHFAERADFDAAMEHFVDDLVDTRQPLIPGQIEQIRRLAALSVSTPVAQRSFLYRVRDEGEHAVLQVYGNRVTFPRFALDALRYAMEHESFTPADLPGLDDEGRLTLVRRLVREGVLTLS